MMLLKGYVAKSASTTAPYDGAQMEEKQLKKILEDHRKWLNDEEELKRSDAVTRKVIEWTI